MRKFILLCAAGLPLFFLPASCTLLQDTFNQLADPKHETVTFVLPQWPQELPDLTGWKIELHQAQGTRVIASDKLKIKVQKNIPVCITAQPLVKTTADDKNSFFKCAGALYPYESLAQNGKIELTWYGGYAATLMKTVFNSGIQAGYSTDFTGQIVTQFNWERLVQVLQEKQDENPWFLDMQQVLEGIGYNNFNANKLKTSGTLQLELDFPVFSSYIPQNQQAMTIKKAQQNLFMLADSQFGTGVLIYGTSLKNISLEFISLPIYINEEI